MDRPVFVCTETLYPEPEASAPGACSAPTISPSPPRDALSSREMRIGGEGQGEGCSKSTSPISIVLALQ